MSFICLGAVKLGTPRNSEAGCVYQLSHLAAVLFMALEKTDSKILGMEAYSFLVLLGINKCWKRLFLKSRLILGCML